MADLSRARKPRNTLELVRSGLWLALLLALAALYGTRAEAGDDQARPRFAVLAGSEIDYPPFCVVDAAGKPDGFSVELLRAALAAMGRDVVFRTGPWSEVKGWLESGEVQALPLVGRTPEREALFDFTFPYMSLHGAIVVGKDTEGIWELNDLRGKRVAVMKGDNAEEFLRREDRGIAIHAAVTFEEALRELSRGLHDAVVIQRLVAVRLLQEMDLTNLRVINNPIEGFRQDFCFAVKEGDRDVLALLNEGLALVMADGTYRHLHSKWFAALELPANRRIVVGGDHNYPPYEYLDEKGRPAGFTVELSRAIAKEMGLDIEIRLGPWDRVLTGLETGEIDVIQGMFYSPERDLKFDFTPPYLVNHYVGVTRRGEGAPPVALADLTGKSIVVQRGDLIHDYLIKNGLGDRVSLVDAQEDALKALAAGKFDRAVTVRISTMHLIEKLGLANLDLGGKPLFSADYCYAAANNNPALLAQFSEGLKVLQENGEYHRLREKYMGVYDDSPPSLAAILSYVALSAGPLLVIIFFALFWSWSLRRQVASKTEELRSSEERHRLLAEKTLDVIWTMDLDLRFTYVNPAIVSLTGHDVGELLGSRLAEHCDRENFAKISAVIAAELAKGSEGGGVIFETVLLKKNGRPVQVEIHGSAIHDDNGRPISLQGITRDITERVQAGQKLVRSETLLKAAEKLGKIGGWEWDVNSREMFLTEETYRIHDFDPAEHPTRGPGLIARSLECYAEEERPQVLSMFQRCVNGGEPFELECRFTTAQGRRLWVRTAGQGVWDGGRVVKVFGNIQDITKQKQADEARRYQDHLLREMGRIAKIGGWEFDPGTGKGTWTEEAARIHGLDSGEDTDLALFLGLYQGESHEGMERATREAVELAQPFDLELEMVTTQGVRKWVRTIGQPQVENDQVIQVRGSIQDITEMKQTRAELERYNFMLSRLLDVARQLTMTLEFSEAVAVIRQAALDLSGADGVGIVAREGDFCHYLDEAAISPLWKGKRFPLKECISGWVMLHRQSVAIEDVYSDPRIPRDFYRPTFVRSLAMAPIRSEDPVGAIGAYWAAPHAATEQEKALLNALGNMLATLWEAVQARESLGRSEKTLSAMFENMLDGVLMIDVEMGGFVIANAAIGRDLGYSSEELLSLGLKDIHPEEDLALVQAEFGRQLRGEITLAANMPMKRKDGSVFYADVNATPLELEGRSHVLGIFRDITERRRAEERIEHLNRVLLAIRKVNQLIVRERDPDVLIRDGCRVLVENRGYASAFIVLTDDGGAPVKWAEAGLGAAVAPLDEMLGRGLLPSCFDHARNTKGTLLVEDRKTVCGECPLSVDCSESQALCAKLVHETAGFGFIAVAVEAHLFVDEEERLLFSEMADDLAYALHVLAMGQAREAAEKERHSLEGQLLQSQKMESVGRLAGGVAHDFNNMLSVIIGNAELAQAQLETEHPLRLNLEEILNAGKRSADLTRQLLAFARKQTIKPLVLDLNETVEKMLQMLRRLLGEDINVLWKPTANPWPVRMDPAQIDQIMANLCVNARYAILGQGQVVIETENTSFDAEYCDRHKGFHPGEFVMLAVSDDGVGMDRETMERIFEPFFTTRKEGQGTGLGLSTIYGIVKQNEGFINVYSEPGRGTIFKIYFPRHEGGIRETSAPTMTEAMMGRGETVLLVEDEPAILLLGRRILEKLGYVVLSADTPGEALRLAREHVDGLALLITDVIMPEMNGRELSRLIRGIKPDLKCLFTSGYTANVIAHHGVIDEDVHFLQKPVSLQAMARKVREALDS
ncbi:MAG: transporter substrate-binding domain-containing protein [Pseudomonadota bacterium]